MCVAGAYAGVGGGGGQGGYAPGYGSGPAGQAAGQGALGAVNQHQVAILAIWMHSRVGGSDFLTEKFCRQATI